MDTTFFIRIPNYEHHKLPNSFNIAPSGQLLLIIFLVIMFVHACMGSKVEGANPTPYAKAIPINTS